MGAFGFSLGLGVRPLALGGAAEPPAEPVNILDNGTFDDATGLTLGAAWSVSGGALVCAVTGGTSEVTWPTNADVASNSFYKITLVVTAVSALGGVGVVARVGGPMFTNEVGISLPTPGTYTAYLLAPLAPTNIFGMRESGAPGDTFEIDSILVEQVSYTLGTEIVGDSGFDNGAAWTAGAGISVTASKAVFAGAANNTNLTLNSPTEPVQVGAFYQVQTTVDSVSAGRIRSSVGGNIAFTQLSAGTATAFVSAAAGTAPQLRAFLTTTATADNFSVKRVIFDT